MTALEATPLPTDPPATEATSTAEPIIQPTDASIGAVEPAPPAAPGQAPSVPTDVANAAVPVAQPTLAPAPPSENSSASDDTEEPQNALTKQFSDAEWKSLKELRAQLPDILFDAYETEEAKSTAITLWGVTLDPNGLKDAKASVVLMKFLRARNLSVSEGRSMLVNTLRWRQEFDVEKAVHEEFPVDVFGNLGRIYGHDRDGRPNTYNLYGGNKDLQAVFGDVQRFIRWRVQLMEKGVALLDFESVDQMNQVHDYEGVSLSSRDQNSKNAASETTNIMSSHYPELLAKKYFINVPGLMTWIFWLFKPIIPAKTLAKMSVVGSGPSTISKALLPTIPADQLPKRYGGKAQGWEETTAEKSVSS